MEPVSIQNPTSSGALESALGGDRVNKEDFMQLLVTQLRNQNPFEPVKNEEFLTQLATFSQLEEQQAGTNALQNLVALQQANLVLGGLAQGASLVGREVTYIDPDTGEEAAGLVDGVIFDAQGVLLSIDGRRIPSGQVVGIGLGSQNGTQPPAAGGGSGSGQGGGTTGSAPGGPNEQAPPAQES